MSYVPALVSQIICRYTSTSTAQRVANGASVAGYLPPTRQNGADIAAHTASGRGALIRQQYQQPPWHHLGYRTGVNSAESRQQLHALGWGVPEFVQLGSDIAIASASLVLTGDHTLIAHTQIRYVYHHLSTPILTVDPYTVRPDADALRDSELFTSLSTVIEFDDSLHIPNSVINWGGADLTKRAPMPVFSGVALSHHQPPEHRRPIGAPWDTISEYASATETPYWLGVLTPGPAPDATAAETHIIMNTVQCYTLPDQTPLALADISIDADLDTVCWKLSCQALNTASAALLTPDATGRKELAIIINGHRWEFFIAKTAQSKTVSDQLNKRFTVTGYSRSQYLAEPYAPARTKSIGTTTAVQAATAELTGTGFTLDWNVTDLPDWTLPNAAFSYQSLAPMAVIKRLASAAGGIVQTDPATDSIIVRPRFSAMPWYLYAIAADATIHESQVTSEQHADAPGILYNAVFVSGETDGVSTTITRQGTNGDSPAADVTDSWIAAIECNTSRGTAELAISGDRVTHTLELPVPEIDEPGVLLPGMNVAVQHTDSSRDYRSYVTAVNISVPGRLNAKVRQTVTLDQPTGWEDYTA
ncbi:MULTISPECIES: hypothetical protein [unclassified Oceanobacter]|uniref:hypothetical protein n=3 Tax=Gammaproteobacteria TaxID=1236 RepID=UPI00273502C5|nr:MULTISPECIES: hypothetical protein [unclassified Oceanobacter]MDP2610016.1 hypothetical protein [Oceanobacter sp. 1_MG-2023]MDP2613348.1 hypothetical protein [Oceanobacter sp. 2_MG-2023]